MNEEQHHNIRRLSAYLHQDWKDEFSTPDEAIASFKAEATEEDIRAVCEELQVLITQIPQIQDSERFLWENLCLYYSPSADGLTVADWLEEVRNILECK